MIERLEGHAGGHCAVTDHRHGLAFAALDTRGDGHAEGCADASAGVADAKGVVLAFAAARESGDAILLPQGAHLLAPTGEDLVRIGLMTHVPDQAIIGGVEHIVQGNGQLDDAQTRAKVPASLANRVQQVLAQLIRQPLQLSLGQAAQAVRRTRAVKQRRYGALTGDLVKGRRHQAHRVLRVKEAKEAAVYPKHASQPKQWIGTKRLRRSFIRRGELSPCACNCWLE